MAGLRLSLRISVILGWAIVVSTIETTTTTDSIPKTWKNNQADPTQAADSNLVCSEVQQMFVMKQIGTADMVPQSPIRGDNLEICKAESTCCTKEMEEKYGQAVKSDFLNIVHATSSHVKNSIATNVAKLQENFVEMIGVSENNTNAHFAEVYPGLWTEAQVPIGQLFSAMTAYMKGQESIDLEESVSSLFDSLFPLVYHHNINPKMNEPTDSFKVCLQETQDEVRPFGDVARRLGVHVSKSLKSARALVQALTVGMETMNLTNHLIVTPECEKALLRLTYCPHCRGLVSAKPCNGYCLNVVHGCLVGVAELEQPWNDFISALERLTLGMRGVYNAEEVLAMLDDKISEAIMHAMENGPEISKKVKRVCGTPRATRETASADGNSSPATSDAPEKVVPIRSASTPDLYTRLRNLMKSLSPSKNFFSSLADTLCNDDKLAVQSEGSCWNGQNIGEYTKTIAGFGMSAQKHNPEMETTLTMDQKIAVLVEKLKHIRQVMMARVNIIPESDSLVNDGSGSGWRQGYSNNYNPDDEDLDNEDGSGSGYGDGEMYNRRTNTRPTHKWPSQRPEEDDDLHIEDTQEKPSSPDNKIGREDVQRGQSKDSSSPLRVASVLTALSLLVVFALSSTVTSATSSSSSSW